MAFFCFLVKWCHSSSVFANFSKKGRCWHLIHHLFTSFFAYQFKHLCRAEVTSTNLTFICHVIVLVYSGKRLIVWSLDNSSSPLNFVDLIEFILFWISWSWVSTRTDVSRISHSLIKRLLASLYVSQVPRYKEVLEVDKAMSLKLERAICSELFWGSKETIVLGGGITDS